MVVAVVVTLMVVVGSGEVGGISGGSSSGAGKRMGSGSVGGVGIGVDSGVGGGGGGRGRCPLCLPCPPKFPPLN